MICCVEWISIVHTGLEDLNTFVDIASNTGEISEMDNDKLQDLLTVASGFQSLIYNFRRGDTYDKLAQQLLTVWEALKRTANLPKLLVSYLCLVRFVYTACMQIEWMSGKCESTDCGLQYQSGKMIFTILAVSDSAAITKHWAI